MSGRLSWNQDALRIIYDADKLVTDNQYGCAAPSAPADAVPHVSRTPRRLLYALMFSASYGLALLVVLTPGPAIAQDGENCIAVLNRLLANTSEPELPPSQEETPRFLEQAIQRGLAAALPERHDGLPSQLGESLKARILTLLRSDRYAQLRKPATEAGQTLIEEGIELAIDKVLNTLHECEPALNFADCLEKRRTTTDRSADSPSLPDAIASAEPRILTEHFASQMLEDLIRFYSAQGLAHDPSCP